MKFVKLSAALAVAVASLAANAAPTELVKNGSFEADPQAAGGYTYRTTLQDWSNEAASGVQPFELRNDRSGQAFDGLNFVELDTNANSNIYQNITGIGKATLSFWHMARPKTGPTNGLGVSFGGTELSVFGVNASGPLTYLNDKSQWKQFTSEVDFGSVKSTKTLSFYALGNSDSYGTSLDKVSIMGSVPEPETYALMLAGLGMMGFIARRRRAV